MNPSTDFEASKLPQDKIALDPSTFQKVWHLKVNDPASQSALWLRFNVLSSQNGFTRVAETWAAFFERSPSTREVAKLAVKQVYPLESVSLENESDIQIGNCSLTSQKTKGSV